MEFARKEQGYTFPLSGSRTASRLVIILGVWSVFWVVCSDYVLSFFVEAPPVLWSVEWVEGAVYVSVSGMIASLLVRRILRENELARRANESKLRSIQAAGLIGIFTWRNGTIIDANDSFLNMLAYSKDDLAGGRLTITRLTAPEYHTLEAEARRELDEKGQSRIFQAELVGKDGARVAVVGGRARIEGDNHYGIGYALDITPLVKAEKEQRQLEEQLQRADRLNALGRLAGGIAHDFNNLLGVIVGYAAMMQGEGLENHVRRESAGEMLKAAGKAKDLIRKLLAFSRKEGLHPEPLDVNNTLRELDKMLSRMLGDTIELRLELAEGVGCVVADSTEVEQVIMNLAVNARDAMPHGGVITIATENVQVMPDMAGFEKVAPGDYVSIRVRDTGAGIDPHIIHQIFEPFFSTKTQIGGTGLGLAIVNAMVTQHGGYIQVRSRPQEGTEFALLLPRSTQSIAPLFSTAAPAAARGTETILVIEDSEEMRRMLAAVLSSLGYKVLPAEDGQRGVEVAHEYGGEIHLLLSDVAMPRLSGPEAVEQIRRERPAVKILLLTGFADSKLLEGEFLAGISILEKPVTPELLSSRIKEILRPGPETK